MAFAALLPYTAGWAQPPCDALPAVSAAVRKQCAGACFLAMLGTYALADHRSVSVPRRPRRPSAVLNPAMASCVRGGACARAALPCGLAALSDSRPVPPLRAQACLPPCWCTRRRFAVYRSIGLCISAYLSIHLSIYPSIHLSIYLSVQTHRHTQTRSLSHTHAHTHTHTHTHPHMRTSCRIDRFRAFDWCVSALCCCSCTSDSCSRCSRCW